MGFFCKLFGPKKQTQPTVSPNPHVSSRPVANGKTHRVTGTKHYASSFSALAQPSPSYLLNKSDLIKSNLVDVDVEKFFYPTTPVSLVQEPDNPYDPNAIKVVVAGQHIGYIKAGSCAHLNKVINEGRIDRIICKISGGPYVRVSSEYDYDSKKTSYYIERGTNDYRAELTVFEK